MKPLRIALTKGRLEKDTVAAFERIGLDCTQVRLSLIHISEPTRRS